eukprot:2673713-Rhodomonas_salina.4
MESTRSCRCAGSLETTPAMVKVSRGSERDAASAGAREREVRSERDRDENERGIGKEKRGRAGE